MKKLLLLAALAATPVVLAGDPVTITEANARTFYAKFVRLTKEPHFVDLATSVLCRPPTSAEIDRDEKALGPHLKNYVHLYASPEAAKAIADSAPEFPEGSVIVKEKLGPHNAATEIGGMVKRAPGFDPANGDWEYFFDDQAGKFTTGKLLANCADCHHGAPKDHVFAAWRLGKK